jgi:hypothetical protein
VEPFRLLGERVEDAWRREEFRHESFPEIARSALALARLHASVTPGDIIDWMLRARTIPPQTNVDVEYPFTLFRAERFSIQAYVWVDGTTDIHDHAFWGAFQVLSGSSIHARYDYVERARVSRDLLVGDLRLREIEALRPGDVREIRTGREFIHSLFHLERPSVTLLVATFDDPRSDSSITYFRSGLAARIHRVDADKARRVRALSLVHATAPDAYPDAVAKLAAHHPAEAFFALKHASETLDADGLMEVMERARSEADELFDSFAETFEENRRLSNIIERRALITDATHRFFLAVLLNAPDRAAILRLIADRFPDANPVDTIMTWVRELAATPVEGPLGPSALGVPLEEPELAVLDALIRTGDDASVFAALAHHFDATDIDAQREDILELIRAFRDSLFFRPLLA